MTDAATRIRDNLADIRGRIAAAAERCGRRADDVKLVAVTKYVGPDEIRALVAAGWLDIGESRPQDLWKKTVALADLPIRWHLVGHLQRNKVRRTLPLVTLLHSADSPRLLEAVNQFGQEVSRVIPVLLEVNISGDATKTGFALGELETYLPRLAELAHVRVDGLMAMAGLADGPDRARDDFRRLRQLRDRLVPAGPPGITLGELSMGMSGDFEVAIEEGATMVRIGSALFEGLSGERL